MHKSHILSKKILQDHQMYPEVIVSYAREIFKFFEKKRADMLWLWHHHELLHIYIDAHNQSMADQQKSGHYGRVMYAGRAARGAVMRHLHSKRLPVEFEDAINRLNRPEYSIQLMSITLDAMMLALNCSDTELMYRYLTCVNAKRKDDAVDSVSFIHIIPHNAFAEILAWRLMIEAI